MPVRLGRDETEDYLNHNAPLCVRCGAKMNLRHGSMGDFWGCSKYPECQGKLPVEMPEVGDSAYHAVDISDYVPEIEPLKTDTEEGEDVIRRINKELPIELPETMTMKEICDFSGGEDNINRIIRECGWDYGGGK